MMRIAVWVWPQKLHIIEVTVMLDSACMWRFSGLIKEKIFSIKKIMCKACLCLLVFI